MIRTLNLRSAGDRGSSANTLPAEFDVTGEVVSGRGIGLRLTGNTEGGDTSTSVRTSKGTRDDQLDLTEGTTRRHVGLAHILEFTSTRTSDGGGVLGCTRDGTTNNGTRGPSGRGQGGGSLIETIDNVHQTRDRNEVASISRDLLDKGRNGGHLVLYFYPRKKNGGGSEEMSKPDFELPLTNPVAYAGQNGRVNLASRSSAGGPAPKDFPGYKYQTTAEKGFEADMLRGNWEVTPVSSGFFSPDNIRLLQNAIRRYVFEKSQPKGYVIDDQSVDELKIIMRAIYYQYAKNLPFNVSEQVQELNQYVVNWSGPHILSAVDHYYYYLDDISHMPVPLQRSQNLSSAGTKSLPFTTFV